MSLIFFSAHRLSGRLFPSLFGFCCGMSECIYGPIDWDTWGLPHDKLFHAAEGLSSLSGACSHGACTHRPFSQGEDHPYIFRSGSKFIYLKKTTASTHMWFIIIQKGEKCLQRQQMKYLYVG